MAEVDVLKLERDAAQKICETYEAEANALDAAVKELLEERAGAQAETDRVYEELQALRMAVNKKVRGDGGVMGGGTGRGAIGDFCGKARILCVMSALVLSGCEGQLQGFSFKGICFPSQ